MSIAAKDMERTWIMNPSQLSAGVTLDDCRKHFGSFVTELLEPFVSLVLLV